MCWRQAAGAVEKWEEKCWGLTGIAVDSPYFQRHALLAEKGGCSIHYHKERANLFLVLSGTILVREFFHTSYEDHILTADNTLVIPSLVVHQFIVLEAGHVIEEYWPDRGGRVCTKDIVRLEQGRADITP